MTLAIIPAHDKYGCSSSSRWLKCPGSIELAADCENTSSAYANEGTTAHEIVAGVLGGKAMPDHVKLCNRCSREFGIGACSHCGGREYRIDRDMPVYCQQYVDFVMAVKDANYLMHMSIEVRIQSERFPGHGGTIDCYLIYKDDAGRVWCHVIDLKYGKGVPVDADANTQLRCYAALAKERHPNVRHFRGTIVQPRVGDGMPHTVEISLEDLANLDMEIMDAMVTDHLAPGNHCRWCPASAKCPAIFERAKELAQQEFDTEFDLLDDEGKLEQEIYRLRDIMAMIPALKRLIAETPQRMLQLMQQGVEIEGYKPVARLGYRTWTSSEDELVNTLRERGVPEEDLWKRTLLSPAQVEKLGHKKAIDGLTFRPLRGYAVALASDKRPKAELANVQFEEYQEEEE